MTKHLIALLVLAAPLWAEGETTTYPDVLPLRERAALMDTWLKDRLETIVPALMRERGVDMWVLIAREYNEDPVVKTMLPATWLSARRRTVLVFFDTGTSVERLAVSRYAVGDLFDAAWVPEDQPDQWARLAEIIAERNPKRIAINVSPTFALADGLTKSQYDGLVAALPDAYRGRLVQDPALAIGWLERRTPAEMAHYKHIVGLAHAIIHEGFSSAVTTPGKTTVQDMMWWFRERIRDMRVTAWFHPTVSIQRQKSGREGKNFADAFDAGAGTTIMPGDLIHVDFGITYLGLNTDTQHHAYVLRAGESDAPAGLKAALAAGNRLQDILTNAYAAGKSGDAALAETRARAIAEGLEPLIYTHPIGKHGHGAGATIGLWDQQGGTGARGAYPIVANTAWSIELSSTSTIPEWGGQRVRIMLEEDAFFDGTAVSYIDGRQTDFHVIGAQ